MIHDVTRRQFLGQGGAFAAGLYTASCTVSAPTAFVVSFLDAAQSLNAKEPGAGVVRPNIVYLLVDDLGWSDLGCYGSDLHETPNIDRLARQGMRFTDAYAAAPVCTPTRAALMTGEHPARLHMTIWREGAKNPPRKFKVIPPATRENLPLEKITIAERLKEAGYATAHIGKWHLGDGFHYPETQGFDVNIGATHWGCPATFYYPFRGELYGDYRYVPGLPIGKEGDYLTDRLTDEALNVIDSVKDRPFFLYMAYYTVHFPIKGKPKLVVHYKKKLQSAAATYQRPLRGHDAQPGRERRQNSGPPEEARNRRQYDRHPHVGQRRLHRQLEGAAGRDQQRALAKRKGIALRGRGARAAVGPVAGCDQTGQHIA